MDRVSQPRRRPTSSTLGRPLLALPVAACLVLLLGLALLATAAPASAQGAPHLPLTDPLPPLPIDSVGEDRVEQCGADGLVCIRFVEERLAEWEAFFGCDHRAVFPTVYRLLTRETRLVLEDDPSTFDDPAGLGFEAVAFYELYEQMITAHLDGQAIPPAWETAMDAANEGDWTGGHDMLLAINAHVQRDMPFAVARAGLVLPDGETSRKADHDRFNQVLTAAYPTIVQEVGTRYDPIMLTVDSLLFVDDLASQQLVSGWREGVWRNAERLESTTDTPLHDLTVETIEQQAQLAATLIATGEIPGHREARDAHCRQQLAQAEPTPADSPAPDPPGPTDPPTPTGQGTPPGQAPGQTSPAPAGGTVASQTGLPATGSGAALVGLVAMGLAATGGTLSRGARRGPPPRPDDPR